MMENKMMEKEKNNTTEIMSVSDIIQKIKNVICDDYCKYTETYDDVDELIHERCENCVLLRL